MAFFKAVAARAQVTTYQPDVDNEGVDWGFGADVKTPLRHPRVELQLKSWQSAPPRSAPSFAYDLRAKDYNRLVLPTAVPRILVVVLVPTEPQHWMLQSRKATLLRHCAFWTTLRGMPETFNTSTERVYIKTSDILTPVAMLEMLLRVGAGGLP